MPKIEENEALLAEQLIDGELSVADRKALEEGESLDEIKAKLKPKKSAISQICSTPPTVMTTRWQSCACWWPRMQAASPTY